MHTDEESVCCLYVGGGLRYGKIFHLERMLYVAGYIDGKQTHYS